MIAIRRVYRRRYHPVAKRLFIGTVVVVVPPTGGVPNQLMMVGVGI